MPIPERVQSATGLAVLGAAETLSLTGCTAGNLVIVQSVTDNNSFCNHNTIVNMENLAGTDNALTNDPSGSRYQIGSPTVGGQQYVQYGRVIANGTVSVDIAPNATEDVFATIHEFRNVALGTLWTNIATATPIQSQADTATIAASNVASTPMSDCLAIAFVGVNINNALGPFTGSGGTSGATYAEDFEFSSGLGTAAAVQLQTAAMTTQGTLTGGSYVMGSAASWGCISGFALIPYLDPQIQSRVPMPMFAVPDQDRIMRMSSRSGV